MAILIEQGRNRVQELLPVRYARMKADPFAFLRGAAAVMATDLERKNAEHRHPDAGLRRRPFSELRHLRHPRRWRSRTDKWRRCRPTHLVFGLSIFPISVTAVMEFGVITIIMGFPPLSVAWTR